MAYRKLLVFAFLYSGCADTTPIRSPDLGKHTGDMRRANDMAHVTGTPDMSGVDAAAPSVDAAMQDDLSVDDGAAQQDDQGPGDTDAAVDLLLADLRAPKDGGVADMRHRRDLAMPPGDMALPPGDMALVPGDMAGGCEPKVNEVMTGTKASASEEFVEVYNPCPNALDLTGYKLVYRAGSNASPPDAKNDNLLFPFAAGTMFPAGGYLVYAGANFPGMSDGKLSTGLKDGLGAVGIRNAQAALVDSVGYSDPNSPINPANAFIETSPAAAPPVVASPGNSIGRLPNGTDTNDNSKDFMVTRMITPGAANK